MASADILELKFDRSPTVRRFHHSNAFVRGLMGPVGSGKSVGCCFEIFDIARNQWPNAQGVRKTRMVIVRNTSPQLETTTIKTWVEWFPEKIFGRISRKAPFTQMMRYKLSDGTQVESEIIFLALDQPEDMKKLLSLECTCIWYNEAREIQKALVDVGTGRVGRYPSVKDRPDDMPEELPWPTRACIILDTNPPNDDHWWYNYAENDGWRKDPETDLMISLEKIPETDRWEFFRQPGGRSPDAENLDNLPPGYYKRQMLGKDADYIRVMVDGDYGMLQHGKPVYKASFNKELHVSNEPIPYDSLRPVYLGVDSSGRNPSAVFGQESHDGSQLRIVRELVCEDISAEVFSRLLRKDLDQFFKDNDVIAWGDPAGGDKTSSDDRTYYDIVRAFAKVTLKPSPVLRIKPRIEAVRSMFMRLGHGGKPEIIISPDCKVLVSGLAGGYKFKQLQVSGEARYDEKPDKSVRYADVNDALQYLVCGRGGYNKMLGRGGQGANETNQSIADIGSWSI